MSTNDLLQELNAIENAKRDNRQRVANIVLDHPELMQSLVDITFFVQDAISIKAAWILEWICTHHDLNRILPHLDTFATTIRTLQFDGSIRPCAKICEHLAVSYTRQKEHLVKEHLQLHHIEKIIETGFDWLIT